MTREQVKAFVPDISKEALDALMNASASEIQALKQDITTITQERDGLKTQLDEAGKTISSYKDKDVDLEKARQAAADWEAKHRTDVEALQAQLAATQYDFAAQTAMSGLKFTSAAAKRAFAADLKAKGLTLENGTLSGFDAYVTEYKAADPDAFQGDKPNPSFSQAGASGGSPSGISRAAAAAIAASTHARN